MFNYWWRLTINANMKVLDRELKRLHTMMALETDYDIDKGQIEIDMKKIREHMLTVSKSMAGLEY